MDSRLISRMLEEARQAPAAVRTLMSNDHERYAALVANLREQPPHSVVTVARGSSDHAAQFMSYLIMARLGRLVTSLPMSLLTVHHSPLDCAGLTCFAFSQAGRSPDLIVPTEHIRRGGGRTVALVNADASPLAAAAEWSLSLHAGPERSIAATKSHIAQLVAGARLVAEWQADEDLRKALQTLPEALNTAVSADWSAALPVLVNAEHLFVIGRGSGLAIAAEAALKFKEVCGIQAEAFSAAEIKHGPMALIGQGYPLLMFAPRGPAQAGVLAIADEMCQRGARVLLVVPPETAVGFRSPQLTRLPLVATAAEDLDPISAIQSFYPMIEALARQRGRDPDQPPHLAKVTCTL